MTDSAESNPISRLMTSKPQFPWLFLKMPLTRAHKVWSVNEKRNNKTIPSFHINLSAWLVEVNIPFRLKVTEN